MIYIFLSSRLWQIVKSCDRLCCDSNSRRCFLRVFIIFSSVYSVYIYIGAVRGTYVCDSKPGRYTFSPPHTTLLSSRREASPSPTFVIPFNFLFIIIAWYARAHISKIDMKFFGFLLNVGIELARSHVCLCRYTCREQLYGPRESQSNDPFYFSYCRRVKTSFTNISCVVCVNVVM